MGFTQRSVTCTFGVTTFERGMTTLSFEGARGARVSGAAGPENVPVSEATPEPPPEAGEKTFATVTVVVAIPTFPTPLVTTLQTS